MITAKEEALGLRNQLGQWFPQASRDWGDEAGGRELSSPPWLFLADLERPTQQKRCSRDQDHPCRDTEDAPKAHVLVVSP